MKERKDKGLCYNCDEKWNLQHHCTGKRIYMMEEVEWVSKDEEEKEKEVVVHSETEVLESHVPKISLHAISGTPKPSTMRLMGKIGMSKVVIVVDTGSTHNFLDPSVAKKNNLPVTQYNRLRVRVANGDTMLADGGCEKVAVKMQGHGYEADFYLLPLGGCDVVLGVSWLSTLGPILWDLLKMTMSFDYKGRSVLLHGLQPME